MSSKRKKIIIFIIIIAVLLFATVLTIFSSAALRAARSGEAVLKEIARDYNRTPSLGELVNLETECVLPWGQDINEVMFLPGEGFVQQGNIAVKNAGTTLHHRRKIITVPLKSYRSGELVPGKLKVAIERPLYKNGNRKITLPLEVKSIKITPRAVTDRDQLPLADELQKAPVKPHKSIFAVLSALLLLIIILTVILIKKHRQKPLQPLQPWEIARRELEDLRQTADNGKQPLPWCVARLSDVVRNYLSKRFALPATRQTTSEFFAALKRGKSPLNRTQISYLEDFLTSADLVKFANIRPDKELFEQAVNRAGELIDETAGGNTAAGDAAQMQENEQ